MPKRHYATPIANFGSVSRPWSTSPARKEEHFHHTTSMNGFTYGTASKNKCRDGACPHPGAPYSHASWLLLAFAPSWCPQSSSFITLRSSHLPHPLNAILFPPIHVWDRAPSIRL